MIFKGTGTVLNIFTVLLGASLGKFLGDRLPNKIRETVMHSLGLMTIVIGVKMALETKNILIVLGSLLLGGILGEFLKIDAGLHRFAHWAEERLKTSESTFAEGFITASLVFCVGPMTIMGSIQDGVSGDYKLLAIKSVLDGFAALAFASTLGWGVAFATLTILLYQGGLTLGASFFSAFLSSSMIGEMTATGGVLIFAIGLELLELKKIRVANLLPALLVAPFIVYLTTLW
jgi:hypothetical protein